MQGALWLATIHAAVIIGLGHLPTTAALVKLTPLLVGRAILLNGFVGVATGYLFWRYGTASKLQCWPTSARVSSCTASETRSPKRFARRRRQRPRKGELPGP